jgi:hypothetical protein
MALASFFVTDVHVIILSYLTEDKDAEFIWSYLESTTNNGALEQTKKRIFAWLQVPMDISKHEFIENLKIYNVAQRMHISPYKRLLYFLTTSCCVLFCHTFQQMSTTCTMDKIELADRLMIHATHCIPIMQFLIAQGASLSSRTIPFSDNDPLRQAIVCRNIEGIKFLVRHGFQVTHKHFQYCGLDWKILDFLLAHEEQHRARQKVKQRRSFLDRLCCICK